VTDTKERLKESNQFIQEVRWSQLNTSPVESREGGEPHIDDLLKAEEARLTKYSDCRDEDWYKEARLVLFQVTNALFSYRQSLLNVFSKVDSQGRLVSGGYPCRQDLLDAYRDEDE